MIGNMVVLMHKSPNLSPQLSSLPESFGSYLAAAVHHHLYHRLVSACCTPTILHYFTPYHVSDCVPFLSQILDLLPRYCVSFPVNLCIIQPGILFLRGGAAEESKDPERVISVRGGVGASSSDKQS